ncbi:hypothetical protein SAMN05192561_10379 [Halopenitus malekzadehii]|uniref:DUF8113 domain-containing protein n=1 Tax=Halopenitus malekzadehii TaxID=1267564 RepID=A0A1H6IST5_9EURY|nr:hypothetical protein [Halopenitus malekzadehii]SEH49467.1 hypothetical protein SAMN05192561_10379 [Halopenitus malekzadehii]
MPTPDAGDGVDDDGETDAATDDDAFAREVEHARDLLDADVDALFAGVVRDGEVETTFSQHADDREQEALQPLALLAAHLRLVSNEAGVDPSTVAGDAATLAGQVEEVPTSADDLPEE